MHSLWDTSTSLGDPLEVMTGLLELGEEGHKCPGIPKTSRLGAELLIFTALLGIAWDTEKEKILFQHNLQTSVCVCVQH